MMTTTRCYQLALAFRAHAMVLVPAASRGNELRTRLERATWSAIEAAGEQALDDSAREAAAGSVRRALIVLDVLVGETRVPEADAAPVRLIAKALLSDLTAATQETPKAARAPAKARERAVPASREPVRSRPGWFPTTRVERPSPAGQRRPSRFGLLRRELFLTLLGPSPT